jgi:hypothetical protein
LPVIGIRHVIRYFLKQIQRMRLQAGDANAVLSVCHNPVPKMIALV